MSKEVSFKRTRVGAIVCAVLMLAVLVLQFTPFWHVGEGEEQQDVSIGAYVWFPSDHKEVDTYMKEQVSSDYTISGVVGIHSLVLVLSAVGLVLCLIKPTMPVTPVVVIGSSLSGLVGCLGMKAFQLGATWLWLLILFIAALVMGGLTLYWRIKQQ